MRRVAATLLSAVVVTALLGVTSSSPASASWVCAGNGTMITAAPFVYLLPTVVGTQINTREVHLTPFSMTFTTGACVHVPSASTNKTITATGLATGWCGLASGAGTTANGGRFAWIGVGSFMILTGQITGVLNVVPDIPGGESCSPIGPGANRFIFTGAFVLLNCADVQQADELQGPNTTGVLTNDKTWHMWVTVCRPDTSLTL